MIRTLGLVALLGSAACAPGAGRVERSADLITIGTYLASPNPNIATRKAATRQCLLRGQAAMYQATRIGPRGGYEHVYRCVWAGAGR